MSVGGERGGSAVWDTGGVEDGPKVFGEEFEDYSKLRSAKDMWIEECVESGKNGP